MRAKEGDTKAFERLVEKHISSVLQVVNRILPSGEIDDVLQDVWLHVFVGLDGLREPALFEKWIRTIAYNRAMQWHRKSYAETAVYPRIWEPSYVCDESEQTELRLDISDALELLSPGDRQAVVLHYVAGWSSSEIAEMQGKVASTVRWRLSRSVNALKNILEKGGIVDDDRGKR